MQIDIVGPFRSPVYKYAQTGIDVFFKYLFAVPFTNVSGDTVARELTKFFFMHSYTNSIGFRNDVYIQINARTHITTRNPDQSCNIKTSTYYWTY